MTEWKRPETVPVPQVWRRCVGLKEWNGKVLKYRVQDVPEDMHEDIVEFMSTHFFRDEVTCQSLQIVKHPKSQKELQDIWRKTLKQNCALVALLEDEDGNFVTPRRIVGVNVTGVSRKGEKISADMFEGYVTRTIVRDLLVYASNIVDVFRKYDVHYYMTALGLCVDPEFRGQGVGLEILRARTDLGRAVGLKVTMTVFTGIASQKLAHKYGMEVLAEVPYDRFKNPDGSPVYPNIKNPTLLVMAKRLDV